MTRAQSGELKQGVLGFRCNICGTRTSARLDQLGREAPSCPKCRSSVRMRALIHILSTELFGQSLALSDFPRRPDLKGVGMSDWIGYARPLARMLGYQNTFYDVEPRLDITSIETSQEASLDFVISADVLEHVAPPVSVAFANLKRLLKPGGVLVLSVPYSLDEGTVEHFPELHEYRIVKTGPNVILENATRDGRRQVFRDVVLHGGTGVTVEMRVFAEASLIGELQRAGFARIHIYREPHPAHGVVFKDPWSLPLSARAE